MGVERWKDHHHLCCFWSHLSLICPPAVLLPPHAQSSSCIPGPSIAGKGTQVLLYIATSAGITTLYVAMYFIPIYFQFTDGDSALKAAFRLLPFVIVAISVNLESGYFLSAIKVYMLIYIISGVLLTVGGALLTAYLNPSMSTGTLYGLCVVTAIGSGLAMLTGYSIASLTTKSDNASAALRQNVSQLGG